MLAQGRQLEVAGCRETRTNTFLQCQHLETDTIPRLRKTAFRSPLGAVRSSAGGLPKHGRASHMGPDQI